MNDDEQNSTPAENEPLNADQPMPANEEALEGEVLDNENSDGHVHGVEVSDTESHLRRLMTYNFLEFASYVIKDRAIPDVNDGLKPVQRRILHTLFIKDDGKYHKVANIVGECMKFHPHGDSSIYGALITIANKEYFIDRQGNFGNIHTGDSASAARYIECRLTPLAREVLFNKETTEFIDSYDGRNLEPISLPAKVPALLMLGTDGIAVGMATKVLPHNFVELLKAQIDLLRNKRIQVYPDFIQAGIMDVSEYNQGCGKVKVRAKIERLNKKTLIIREVAAGTTTESLMHSIEEACKNGKIKLSAINDYTAENVEIELTMPRGVDSMTVLDALYAYTQCEVSISSNITVIQNARPINMTVPEVLYHNTQMLVDYLRWELEIELGKLNDRFHQRTLEQIFIENRIYKRIETAETQALVFSEVREGLEEFRHLLRRDISDDDIDRLLKIPIRRISLFDINKNKQELDEILLAIEEIKAKLANMKDHTIGFIKNLLKKYGKDHPRRTVIQQIAKIDKKQIAQANVKLHYDKKKGYIGTDVAGADYIKCTEFDRVIIFYRDGRFKVCALSDKLFVGKFMDLYIVNKEQVYSVVYTDKKSKVSYHKRCLINKFMLDKEYRLIPEGAKLELLETNYSIVLECELEENSRAKDTHAEIVFDDVEIRSATARGFKTAARPITKFLKKKRGTEKSPAQEKQEADDAIKEEEEEKKRILGWKAPEPIRFSAPPKKEEIPEELAEGTTEADLEEVETETVEESKTVNVLDEVPVADEPKEATVEVKAVIEEPKLEKKAIVKAPVEKTEKPKVKKSPVVRDSKSKPVEKPKAKAVKTKAAEKPKPAEKAKAKVEKSKPIVRDSKSKVTPSPAEEEKASDLSDEDVSRAQQSIVEAGKLLARYQNDQTKNSKIDDGDFKLEF